LRVLLRLSLPNNYVQVFVVSPCDCPPAPAFRGSVSRIVKGRAGLDDNLVVDEGLLLALELGQVDFLLGDVLTPDARLPPARAAMARVSVAGRGQEVRHLPRPGVK